jgi:2-aminoadipate transaminase
LHSSTFDQYLILEFLQQEFLTEHLQRLITSYAGKMNLMASRLESRLAANITFDRPEGGMFIWATLGDGIDTHKLFELAIGQGVAFVPGAAFYRDNRLDYSMRLNFTNSKENEILLGVDRLADLIQTC